MRKSITWSLKYQSCKHLFLQYHLQTGRSCNSVLYLVHIAPVHLPFLNIITYCNKQKPYIMFAILYYRQYCEYLIRIWEQNVLVSAQRNWVFATNSNFKIPTSHATWRRRPFHISNYLNSVTSNNLSLKYQRFTSWGCKDRGLKNMYCSVISYLYRAYL